VTLARAFAKINLSLVVGPLRRDGKHEVATVLERLDLHDLIEIERIEGDAVILEGFDEDTLVRGALERLSNAMAASAGWQVRIEKRIPVGSGLGGGSSDAATALRLAKALTVEPRAGADLHAIAAELGADVPFFLAPGPQLGVADGTELSPLELPQDYFVLVALPHDEHKESTATVYRHFDERRGDREFEHRRDVLLETLGRVERPSDLAELPANDLVSSSLARRLDEHGAFRADVSGAGPAVYGLFERDEDAARAEVAVREVASTWRAKPVAGP
jgi:4-diphosphocytidyl-2-C-methyl-D-erythritol kinase